MATKKAKRKTSTKTSLKRSSMDVKAKAKRAVRAVLVGAAAGAIVGAVRGAALAGSKEMGLLRRVDQGSEREVAAPARKRARGKRASAGATARSGSR